MNTQTLDLDLSKDGLGGNLVRVGQGDKSGTTIQAYIFDNGEDAALSGFVGYLEVLLPNKRNYYRAVAALEGNVATVTVDENKLCSVPGYTDEAYFAFEKDGVRYSTERFAIEILRCATEGQQPAKNWDDAIDQLISRGNAAVSAANTAAANANDAADAANKAATRIEAAVSSATAAATAANAAASNADSAAASATTAATAANDAAQSATTAAASANDAPGLPAQRPRVPTRRLIRQIPRSRTPTPLQQPRTRQPVARTVQQHQRTPPRPKRTAQRLKPLTLPIRH